MHEEDGLKYRIRIKCRTLKGNHHGPDHTTLRRTWQIVRMGSYAKYWRLYVYRGDGRAHYLDLCFPNWLGSWPGTAGSEPRR